MHDWYHKLTLAQLKGRKVRSRIRLGNSLAELPPGTIFEIRGKQSGLELLSLPCAMCGLRVSIRKVSAGYVELLPTASQAQAERAANLF